MEQQGTEIFPLQAVPFHTDATLNPWECTSFCYRQVSV